MKISPIHVDNLSGLEYTLVGRRSVIICPEELFLNIPQTDFPSLIKVSVILLSCDSLVIFSGHFRRIRNVF
jgi:hypothetical protein